MGQIRRNVEIGGLEINSEELKIIGKKGGEMTFLLKNEISLYSRSSGQPLVIDFYRPSKIPGFDISNYTGNKGEIIELKMTPEQTINTIVLFIFSPNYKLIEYSKLKWHHKSNNNLFARYKTKLAHQFREVKIVCGEISQSQR